MPEKKQVPHGSLHEEQMAESILYGLLWGLLDVMGPIIATEFNFAGAEVHTTSEADREMGVIYDGLTIHMASGDYQVTVKRTNTR